MTSRKPSDGTVEVNTRPEAKDDIVKLPSDKLKLEAMKFILRLRMVPRLGKELDNYPGIGDLSDCRKLFFDDARYRVVYRLLPDDTSPTEVDVIAVGKRAMFKVYVDAVARLGR